ncbi:MAG: PilN domain-containing protein [Candidatus Puniceispirillaceae bacterium]
MASTLSSLAQILRPLGGGTDTLVAVKLHSNAVTVAEIRNSGKEILVDHLASVSLPRILDLANFSRQQDMVADTIRSMRDQGMFSAQDAGIIIPPGILSVRQINLPYTPPNELAKEGRFIDFWAESEPDIAKFEEPYFSYHVLVSSENDDLTRVILTYAEEAVIRPWADLLLAAHLNPVFLDAESISLANYRYATLPRDEKRQSQAILHVSENRLEIIAFQQTRMHTIRLEVSEFDLILLKDIEAVEDPTGDFWDEVGGRLANTMKQAVLFLQEELDFAPFSIIYIAVDSPNASNLVKLLDKHFTLAPLSLWNTAEGANLAQSVSDILTQVPNKSVFASAFGLGMQRLGTFGTQDNVLIKLNMLPSARTLLRNRQVSVISRTLVKLWLFIFILMGLWTGGLVLPQYLESQVGSRGYEAIASDAAATESQLTSVNNELNNLESELTALGTELRARGRVQFMDTLPDLVPDGVELDTLKIANSTALTLTGYARSSEAINLFVSELTNSGLANNTQVNTVPPNDTYAYTFFTLTGTVTRED